MCGNFETLKSKRLQKQKLEQQLAVEVIVDQLALDLSGENIYPSAKTWILDRDHQLRSATWGLIPAWSRDPKIGRKTFNARSESMAVKPAFRDAYRDGRCVVPAQAWWEWDRAGRKIRVAPTGPGAFLFAGLEVGGTFTVVTKESSSTLQALHSRQPVLLSQAQALAWLSGVGAEIILEVPQGGVGEPLSVQLTVEEPEVGKTYGMDLG